MWAMLPIQSEARPRDGAAPRAFDDVYREFADLVFRFCVTQVGSLAVAEEVTAETFAAAFAAYERFRPGSDPRPWLLRIARNASVDHHRRMRRAAGLVALLSGRDLPRSASSVEELVERREEVRRVVTAIAALPMRDRQLVGLRLAGQLSFNEIAAITRRSPDAVRRATERALRRVRQSMEA